MSKSPYAHVTSKTAVTPEVEQLLKGCRTLKLTGQRVVRPRKALKERKPQRKLTPSERSAKRALLSSYPHTQPDFDLTRVSTLRTCPRCQLTTVTRGRNPAARCQTCLVNYSPSIPWKTIISRD